MGFIIEDGSGDGFKTKVDKENRISTFSDVRTQIAFISEVKQQAYFIGTGRLNVGTTRGLMIYFRNTSQTSEVHISTIFISWSGGNTNHDRVLFTDLEAGLTAPTGNNNSLIPRNLNSGSGNLASATVFGWDGVGTGMTGSTPGITVTDTFFNRGNEAISLNDSFIIQFNDSIGISFEGEEAGIASVGFSFYFKDLPS